MSYKPLNLLEILDSPIKSTTMAQAEMQLYSKIRAIELELGITSEVDVLDLPKEPQEKIVDIYEQIKMLEHLQYEFNNAYKKSLNKLVEVNKGLPVHINAWDIHDHNLDVDNIVDTYKGVINDDDEIPLIDNGDYSLLDFFTDNSSPVFATAPYNICAVQLQSPETYDKTMGQVMTDDILKTMRSERLGRDYGIHTEEDYKRFEDQYLDTVAMENADNSCELFCIVQQYTIDEFIEFMHLGHKWSGDKDVHWGFDIQDTLLGQDIINFGFTDGGTEVDLQEFLTTEMGKVTKFVVAVDIINKSDGVIFYESTILSFYDEHGSPTTARRWEPIAHEDYSIELTHSDMFTVTALEKVFQWWNSDNDLLEVGDLPLSPSVRKRVKKYNKKRNSKRSITYKTLKVRPTLKVIDSDGVERTPRLREIAQHTRRGHWAHYGINGKGKLFGKYTKSVYRKPKTIGKLSSGLVLKDYELLEVKDD